MTFNCEALRRATVLLHQHHEPTRQRAASSPREPGSQYHLGGIVGDQYHLNVKKVLIRHDGMRWRHDGMYPSCVCIAPMFTGSVPPLSLQDGTGPVPDAQSYARGRAFSMRAPSDGGGGGACVAVLGYNAYVVVPLFFVKTVSGAMYPRNDIASFRYVHSIPIYIYVTLGGPACECIRSPSPSTHHPCVFCLTISRFQGCSFSVSTDFFPPSIPDSRPSILLNSEVAYLVHSRIRILQLFFVRICWSETARTKYVWVET